MRTKRALIAQMPAETSVPTEFQLFPYGQVQVAGGDPFTVDEESMDQVVRQFTASGLDMVIDYEHQTEGKTDEYDYSSPDGRAPAAGWIKALENRGKNGLWARVEWTTKAREYLANKEYRYFSPVFYTSKATKRLVALVRVALTNAPRLRGIEPIVSKQTDPGGTDMEFLKRIAKLLGLPETANEEQVSAALTSLQGIADYFKSVASSVGLAETASKDDVTRAISGLRQKTQVVACKDVLDALGLQADSKTNEVVATIHALRQRPDATLAQEFASLKTKLAERDRDDLVTAALKEGKITPAQKEWADAYALRDAEGFRLFVAKAPQVVPTTPVVPKKDDKAGSALDETQLNINKMLGISDETWKKYNPAPAA